MPVRRDEVLQAVELHPIEGVALAFDEGDILLRSGNDSRNLIGAQSEQRQLEAVGGHAVARLIDLRPKS